MMRPLVDRSRNVSRSSVRACFETLEDRRLMADVIGAGATLSASLANPHASTTTLTKAGWQVDSTGSTGGVSLLSVGASSSSKFVYKSLDGDGSIVAKVKGTGDEILVRDSASGSSGYVELAPAAGGKVTLSSSAGGNSTIAAPAGSYYLKLKRDGNEYAGYVSTTGKDGDASWILVGTAGVITDKLVNAGIAVGATSAQHTLSVSASAVSSGLSGVTLLATRPVGGQFNAPDVWIPDHIFADLVKTSGGFKTLSGSAASTDSNGWPTSDFTITLATAEAGSSVDAGRYTVTFNGPSGAHVSLFKTSSGVVLKKVGYSNGLHTYTIDVPAYKSQLGLQITGTNGSVKNLHVIQPGNTSSDVFNKKYLALLQKVKPTTLRFMNLSRVQNNTISSWSQRNDTSDAVQGNSKGIAWEYAVDLANKVGSNLWVTIPAHADNDYVTNLAKLIKGRLRSDLNVYVEYSNEVWSTEYEQGRYVKTKAIQEVQHGGSNLNYDHRTLSGKSDYTNSAADVLGDRLFARRSMEISNIFKGIFGSSSINTRVRVMLDGQASRLDRFDNMAAYLSKFYGSPNKFFYGLGVAPYVNMGAWQDYKSGSTWKTKDSHLSTAGVINALNSNITTYANGNFLRNLASQASKYHMRFVAYETGIDTFGPFNIASKKAAAFDSRMKDVVTKWLNLWFSRGGDQVEWFTLGARSYDTAYGTWGVTNTLNNINTPRIQGLAQVRG